MTVTVIESTMFVAGDYRDFTECKEMLQTIGIEKFKRIEVTYTRECDLSLIKIERPIYYLREEKKDET